MYKLCVKKIKKRDRQFLTASLRIYAALIRLKLILFLTPDFIFNYRVLHALFTLKTCDDAGDGASFYELRRWFCQCSKRCGYLRFFLQFCLHEH